MVLCYRSGQFAAVFAERLMQSLDATGIDYELVLVGNYLAALRETDETPAVVRALAGKYPRIVAVVREKAGMMGWDMRSGLDAARGRAVAVIDGDGQMPPEDVVKVYRALQAGPFDLAKTYRDTRHDGPARVVMSRSYNLLTRILFPRVRVKDINSKPKAFQQAALTRLKLTSDDWFIDAEIIIKASYLGLSITETPTIFLPNAKRPSFISLRAVLEFIKNLARYRLKIIRGTLI